MAADVVLTAKIRQEILDLNNVVISARVYKLIDRLKSWPNVSGVKALSGDLAGKYRIRTGDYRIQFRVERQPVEATAKQKQMKPSSEGTRLKVIVEKVGHRDGFYEG
jgi:mRNA-degrading endonuclease RelE of RelBE toxin-antitoxin system